MGKWKAFIFLFLMLSSNFGSNLAKSPLDVSLLRYSQIENESSILEKIENLAKRDMLDTLVNILKISKPEAGEIVGFVVSFIRAFTEGDSVSAETQMILDAIDKQTEILMDSLGKIARMISDVSDHMTIKFNKLLFEQKYQGLKDNIGRISSAHHNFELILKSYTKKDELVRRLKKFIDDTRSEDLDSKIVQSVRNDESHGGSESIISSYISFILVNDVNLKCTPNQQIESFYSHALRNAHKINLLLLTSYALLEQIEEADYTSDKTFFTNKIESNTNIAKTSISRTFKNYGDTQYQYSVMQKIKKPVENVNFIHFARAFYNFVIHEIDLTKQISDGGYCTSSCKYFYNHNVKYEDRCEGQVTDCDSFPDAFVHEVMDSNRLYSGYTDRKKWFGTPNGPGTSRGIGGYTMGFVYCDVCLCTCNNLEGRHAKRWLYSKQVNAPKGYVITGVRFAEKHRVIYLQPQVSKLVGVGLVDASTTHWMDVPISTFKDWYNRYYPGTITISRGNLFESDSYVLDEGAYVTGFAFEDNPEEVDGELKPCIRLKVTGNTVEEDEGRIFLDDEVEADSDGENSKYIKFEKSSEKYDASQHVLPLLDNNDVILDQPLPLMGLSIQHYETLDDVFNSFMVPQLIAIDVNRS